MLNCPHCGETYVEGQPFCKNPECFRELPQITSVPTNTPEVAKPAGPGGLWDNTESQTSASPSGSSENSNGFGAAPSVPTWPEPASPIAGPRPGDVGAPTESVPAGNANANTTGAAPPVPDWAKPSADQSVPSWGPAESVPTSHGQDVAQAGATEWSPEVRAQSQTGAVAPPVPASHSPASSNNLANDQNASWPPKEAAVDPLVAPQAPNGQQHATGQPSPWQREDSFGGSDASSPSHATVTNHPVSTSSSTGAGAPIMRNCAKCTHPNPLDARSCGRCGAQLLMPCPNCQQEIKADSKRCTKCKFWLDLREGPPNGLVPYQSSGANPSQSYRTGGHDSSAPPREPVLVMTTLDGMSEHRFPLTEGANEVGAKSPGEGIFPDVDLDVMDEDRKVISRRHACIHVQQGMIRVQNYSPGNKTMVDGTILPDHGTAELRRGSRVRFADYNGRIE